MYHQITSSLESCKSFSILLKRKINLVPKTSFGPISIVAIQDYGELENMDRKASDEKGGTARQESGLRLMPFAYSKYNINMLETCR